jgi:biopolymer transport protein ExbD
MRKQKQICAFRDKRYSLVDVMLVLLVILWLQPAYAAGVDANLQAKGKDCHQKKEYPLS